MINNWKLEYKTSMLRPNTMIRWDTSAFRAIEKRNRIVNDIAYSASMATVISILLTLFRSLPR